MRQEMSADVRGTSQQLLVQSSDGSLEHELDAAVRGLGGGRDVVLRFFLDERLAIEHVRTRRPDVVAVETSDVGRLRRFAEAVAGADVPPVLVAIRPGGNTSGPTSEQFFIEAARAGVRDFMSRPVSSSELQQVLERTAGRAADVRRRAGRIVSFLSNKGGVGKSTLAVNTACAVGARRPDRVLLVDASLQMGVCASMLDLDPGTTLVDAAAEIDRLDGTLVRRISVPHESGCRLLAAPRDAVEAASVDDEVLSRVLALARAEFDLVVVDTFPVLDAVAMAILDLSDLVHVVTTRAVPNVIGIRALFGVLDQVGVPISRQRVLVNDTHPAFAGKLSPTDVAAHLERDVEAVFPFDRRVLSAYDVGRPVATSGVRWLGFARAMARFSRDLDEWLANGHEDTDATAEAEASPPATSAASVSRSSRGHSAGAATEAAP